MNAENDHTGRYAALHTWTGHSVRYLRVRAMVRTLVAVGPILCASIYALMPTR